MTRYEDCLHAVKGYVRNLRETRTNESAIEGLVRSYVDQPAYDITFRESLVRDALALSNGERTHD